MTKTQHDDNSRNWKSDGVDEGIHAKEEPKGERDRE